VKHGEAAFRERELDAATPSAQRRRGRRDGCRHRGDSRGERASRARGYVLARQPTTRLCSNESVTASDRCSARIIVKGLRPCALSAKRGTARALDVEWIRREQSMRSCVEFKKRSRACRRERDGRTRTNAVTTSWWKAELRHHWPSDQEKGASSDETSPLSPRPSLAAQAWFDVQSGRETVRCSRCPKVKGRRPCAHSKNCSKELAAPATSRMTSSLGVGGGARHRSRGFRGGHVPARGGSRADSHVARPVRVDAAIGGKTGVNLRAGKNLAGAFTSPSVSCVTRVC